MKVSKFVQSKTRLFTFSLKVSSKRWVRAWLMAAMCFSPSNSMLSQKRCAENCSGVARTGGGELRLLEALEQGIGGAQVLQNDGAWAAVHAAGLDEVVVGAAVDDFALNAGHRFSVYNRSLLSTRICNR